MDSDGKCIVCEKPEGGLVVVLVLILILMTLFFFRVAQSPKADTRSILLFIQMNYLFFGRYTNAFAWTAFLDFNPFASVSYGGRCVYPLSPIQNLFQGVIMPVLCLGVIWILYFFRVAINRALLGQCCCRARVVLNSNVTKESTAQMQLPVEFLALPGEWFTGLYLDYPLHRHIRATVALFINSINSIMNIGVRFLHCVRVGDYYVIESSPAISCRSLEYTQLLPLVYILLILVVLIIPLTAFYLMRRNREILHSDAVMRLRFGAVYEYLKPSYYYMELVSFVRRAALVSAAVFLDTSDLRFVVLFVISQIYFALHLFTSPFASKIDQHRETLALGMLCFVSIILNGAPLPLSDAYAIPISLAVLLVALAMTIQVVVMKKLLVEDLPGSGVFRCAHPCCACCGSCSVEPLVPTTSPVPRHLQFQGISSSKAVRGTNALQTIHPAM
jgi:hypothetical protein